MGASHVDDRRVRDGHQGQLLAIVGPDQLDRILDRLLDEGELVAPHGIRSLSAAHRDEPFALELGGIALSVAYTPAEATTGLFGGNSNWRVVPPSTHSSSTPCAPTAASSATTTASNYPPGADRQASLDAVAEDLTARLVATFREGPDGRRPVHGVAAKFHVDPSWHDLIPFHEYFHDDTGAGLGASQQTGWTGLVLDLLLRRD